MPLASKLRKSQFLRSDLTTLRSAWNTCPPSPGDFITAMTSASPLIFLRGLSTRQRTLTLSKGLCAGSGKLRSGAMSIAKWTSVLAAFEEDFYSGETNKTKEQQK